MSRAAQPSQYFEKKGEVNELRALLRNPVVDRDPKKKQEVIKRVINYMTQGIDMSRLFSEMVMAVCTRDLTEKKLIYTYLTNYAAQNEDMTILAINSLRTDCRNENPKIRGLALRSLSSLRVPSVIEYLIPHITSGLTDPASYVRTIAVTSTVKLFHLSTRAFKDHGFVDVLYEMLRDKDPTVVGTCVCALNETLGGQGGLRINRAIVLYLLNRFHEFSEWHQIAVMELVKQYRSQNDQELFDIMNLLEDCFRHANSGIMLGVAGVFLQLTSTRPRIHEDVCKRLREPLITCVNVASAELAFTAISHIRTLLGRYPHLFDDHFKAFYFRVNDPLYLRLAKLDVLTKSANAQNYSNILHELGEYCVDVRIAPHAIRAIGRVGLRVARSLESVLELLKTLLTYEIPSFTAMEIVVFKDLMRKYPNAYSKFVPIINKYWTAFSTPEAIDALVWILGEFGEHIPNAPYMLELLAERDTAEETEDDDQPTQSKFHLTTHSLLLTAATKLFFKRPTECQILLGRLLGTIINECEQAELRDRALMIYRLLSMDMETARHVFLSPKAVVSEYAEDQGSEEKDQIFREFNTLSIIFDQSSSRFLKLKLPSLDDDDEESECTPTTAAVASTSTAGASAASHDESSCFSASVGTAAQEQEPPVEPPADPASTFCTPIAPRVEPTPIHVDLKPSQDLVNLGIPAAASPAPVNSSLVNLGAPAHRDNGPASAMDLLVGLNLGPSTPVVAPSALLKQEPSIEPAEFQQAWGRATLATTVQWRLSPLPTAEVLSQQCRDARFVVIAAGSVAAFIKLYLYAQLADSTQAFLTEAIGTTDGAFIARIKADPPTDDATVQRVAEHLRKAVGASL